MDKELRDLWNEGVSKEKQDELDKALSDVEQLPVPAHLKTRILARGKDVDTPVHGFKSLMMVLAPVCTAMIAFMLFLPAEQTLSTSTFDTETLSSEDPEEFEDFESLQFYDDEFLLLEELI